MKPKHKSTTVRLRCPVCNRPNGMWSLNFKALAESGTTRRLRKRHPRCQVRLLYKAIREPNGKVSVTVTMDQPAREDLARYFNVGLSEVEAVIDEVRKKNASLAVE